MIVTDEVSKLFIFKLCNKKQSLNILCISLTNDVLKLVKSNETNDLHS